MFLTATQASSTLGVSSCTLRRWHRKGKIAAFHSPGGVRLYDVSNIVGSTTTTTTTTSSSSSSSSPKSYVYARVSSSKQKADLERQQEFLLTKCPQHELVSDIGSGINFKRPGLRTILEQASRRMVAEVVVAHRDRLCRFAYDLIEYILKLNGAKLVVLSQDGSSNDETELCQDILAINTVFVCRMQGKRAARFVQNLFILYLSNID